LSKNLKWKAPLSGRGSSTPIVWGNQVFILTAVPTDRTATASLVPDPRFEKKTTPPACYYRFLVMSLDRQTGKLRWQHTAAERVPHEGHHPTTSYAAGSPATDGRRLYVSFGSFGTYCCDLDGKLLWQRDLGRMNTRLGWGEAVTPVVHGDALLLNWDQEAESALYCLDTRTGETRWKVDRDEHNTSWNTPFVVESKSGLTEVIVNGTNRARGYDLANGKELWACGGMTVNAIPSPVCDATTAYLMSGYNGSAACAVALDAAGEITNTAKVLWKHRRGTPYVPSPLLANGRLWFTQVNQGLLTTLDVVTGKPILDRVRLKGLTSLYASPLAAAGRVYLLGRDGTTLVLRQCDQLEVLATNHLDDEFDASPAAVGKELFLRGEKFVYCLADSDMPGAPSTLNEGANRESKAK
jgi:outer membrane protein assembly factor BamB